MYLIELNDEERRKLNQAKQRYLNENPDKSKVSNSEIVNAALYEFIKG